MKSPAYIYFLAFFTCFLTLTDANSASLKICKEGLAQCKNVISNATEYKSCMRKACKSYYNEQEFQKLEKRDKAKNIVKKELAKAKDKRPLEQIVTCDYGLRKCDSLSYNKEYYFECINQSCKNPDKNAEASCREGHFLCTSEKAKYQECLSFFCPKVKGSYNKGTECKKGRKACKASSKQFWHCVYAVCLGPVYNFKKPAKTRKFMYVKDKKTGKNRRVIINKKTKTTDIIKSPLDSFFLKQGIDPREVRSQTHQKFILMGNPSDYLYCNAGIIRCKTKDVRSCMCTDGTMPIFLNAPPEPRFTSE